MESPSILLMSYQDVLQRSMDVVANNVANSNTSGYKRQDVQFESYLVQPEPDEKLSFIVDRATYHDVSPGSLMPTGNPLDLAIEGKGYFQIGTSEGTRYTRSGSFLLSPDGEIITQSGNKLLDDGGQAIIVDSGTQDIVIANDGTISGTTGAGSITQIGKIKLVAFDNEQALQNVGGSLYTTNESPKEVQDAQVAQGMLERSNVEPVSEMTRMITALRNYQLVSHMMDAETQRLTKSLSKLAKATV